MKDHDNVEILSGDIRIYNSYIFLYLCSDYRDAGPLCISLTNMGIKNKYQNGMHPCPLKFDPEEVYQSKLMCRANKNLFAIQQIAKMEYHDEC